MGWIHQLMLLLLLIDQIVKISCDAYDGTSAMFDCRRQGQGCAHSTDECDQVTGRCVCPGASYDCNDHIYDECSDCIENVEYCTKKSYLRCKCGSGYYEDENHKCASRVQVLCDEGKYSVKFRPLGSFNGKAYISVTGEHAGGCMLTESQSEPGLYELESPYEDCRTSLEENTPDEGDFKYSMDMIIQFNQDFLVSYDVVVQMTCTVYEDGSVSGETTSTGGIDPDPFKGLQRFTATGGSHVTSSIYLKDSTDLLSGTIDLTQSIYIKFELTSIVYEKFSVQSCYGTDDMSLTTGYEFLEDGCPKTGSKYLFWQKPTETNPGTGQDEPEDLFFGIQVFKNGPGSRYLIIRCEVTLCMTHVVEQGGCVRNLECDMSRRKKREALEGNATKYDFVNAVVKFTDIDLNTEPRVIHTTETVISPLVGAIFGALLLFSYVIHVLLIRAVWVKDSVNKAGNGDKP